MAESEDEFPEDEIDTITLEMSPSDLMLSMQFHAWGRVALSNAGRPDLAQYANHLHSLHMEALASDSFIESLESEQDVKYEWMEENFGMPDMQQGFGQPNSELGFQ